MRPETVGCPCFPDNVHVLFEDFSRRHKIRVEGNVLALVITATTGKVDTSLRQHI